MSTTSIYRVTYHFEVNGKRASETLQDNVIAASQDFNSINTVLSNNGKLQNQAGSSTPKTLILESVGHVGGAGAFLS